MKTIFQIAIITITAFLSSAAFAASVLIDFEGQELMNPSVDSEIYDSGFYFESLPDGTGLAIGEDIQGNATKAAAFCPDCTMRMVQTNGEKFDLDSFDLLTTSGGLSFSLTGHFAGGGTVNLLLDSSAYSSWEGVNLDNQWNNLVAVDFGPEANHAFGSAVDNIAVSNVVPIPAAVWLFSSALAGLGWLRRKQPIKNQ
ncbi:MAG: hypothetical protein GY918_01310 [Gammaproteobacteria bacterium]|nr:hypothetical protein [Gammaproteobacteria bacterium]